MRSGFLAFKIEIFGMTVLIFSLPVDIRPGFWESQKKVLFNQPYIINRVG